MPALMHSVSKRDGVVTVAVAAFIRAAELVGVDINLHNAGLLLGAFRLRKEAVIV